MYPSSNYYSSYSDSGIISDPYFFTFFVVGFLLFYFLAGRYFRKMNSEKRHNFFKSVVISSPIWLSVGLFFLILGISSILGGRANFFIFVPTFLISCIFLYLYYLISAYPAQLVYEAMAVLRDRARQKKRQQILTFWTLLDKIKRKRVFFFSLLSFFIVLLFLLNAFFLLGVSKKYEKSLTEYYDSLPVLLFFSLIVIFIYALFEVFYHSKVNIPVIEHRKSTDLKKIIDEMSITTGLPAPRFQVLAVNNPTAFSLFPNFGEPTIYVTAPLLNMADNNELRAVVAHEFAQIFSGRAAYFKNVQNLLIVLRVLAFFLLFLFLLSISPLLVIAWIFLFCRICLNIVAGAGRDHFPLESLFKMFNPPLALVNFLSYFIYYSSARNEEFYADIKTIEFTRYPRGIYSILHKLENYQGTRERLPNRFAYLYFTGENTTFDEIPMPQPLIGERKELLRETAKDLSGLSYAEEDKKAKCLNCRDPMEPIMLSGFYDNFIKAKYCKKCDAFWFKNETMWMLSDLPADLKERVRQGKKVAQELICLQCGIEMIFLEDKTLPDGVELWYCPVCRGQWAFKESVLAYLAYRKRFIKDK